MSKSGKQVRDKYHNCLDLKYIKKALFKIVKLQQAISLF